MDNYYLNKDQLLENYSEWIYHTSGYMGPMDILEEIALRGYFTIDDVDTLTEVGLHPASIESGSQLYRKDNPGNLEECIFYGYRITTLQKLNEPV